MTPVDLTEADRHVPWHTALTGAKRNENTRRGDYTGGAQDVTILHHLHIVIVNRQTAILDGLGVTK